MALVFRAKALENSGFMVRRVSGFGFQGSSLGVDTFSWKPLSHVEPARDWAKQKFGQDVGKP